MDVLVLLYFFKQKTAYEVRISDWSSDVCSSDLRQAIGRRDECHRRWVFRNPRASSTSSSCPNPRGRGGSGIRPARSRDRAPRRPRRFLRHSVSLRREIRQAAIGRSEEHTSELQSLMRISYALFCSKNNTSQI